MDEFGQKVKDNFLYQASNDHRSAGLAPKAICGKSITSENRALSLQKKQKRPERLHGLPRLSTSEAQARFAIR